MKTQGLILIAFAILLPIIWLPGIAQGKDVIALFSQYIGMVALIAMAFSHLIATRWVGVEALFGPLDQSYRIHKWLGIGGLVAVLIHDTIDAEMDGLGRPGALEDIAETAGEISLYGLLIFVAITVATFIPYHLWKWTHRLIGIFFLLGAFHYLLILKPFKNLDPLGIYMGLVCVVGIAAYAYTSAPRAFRPKRDYQITALDKQGNALAVEMAPLGKPFSHRAGQFAFFGFVGAGLTEPHPFTLSAAPDKTGKVRLTIAPLGDFTSRLSRRLSVGQDVTVEGPFGHFGSARNKKQIWIAGGIGITPFVALAQALEDGAETVDLIYSVRTRDDAAHLEELETLAGRKANLTLHLWESAESGRLDAEGVVRLSGGDLKGARVLFCGATPMRKALWAGLSSHGLRARDFHFEAFEIRTGLGLKRFLDFLWERRDRLPLNQQRGA